MLASGEPVSEIVLFCIKFDESCVHPLHFSRGYIVILGEMPVLMEISLLLISGTFITLDICIARLEDVGTADIKGTVEKIRSQRAYSIQMPDQYIFCHLALIEYAVSRGMLNSADLTGFDDREDDSE